jgi:hypothetical protein
MLSAVHRRQKPSDSTRFIWSLPGGGMRNTLTGSGALGLDCALSLHQRRPRKSSVHAAMSLFRSLQLISHAPSPLGLLSPTSPRTPASNASPGSVQQIKLC